MNGALLVAANSEIYKVLCACLSRLGYDPVLLAVSYERAREILSRQRVGLVFVNASSCNKEELAFVREVSLQTDAAVIALTRETLVARAEQALLQTRVLVIGTPLSKAALVQSVKLAQSMRDKLTRIERENEKLRQKIEDLKVVDRAKCCLVAFLRMNEEQAHRYIQKRSMDMRVSQRDVAEDILKTYEY